MGEKVTYSKSEAVEENSSGTLLNYIEATDFKKVVSSKSMNRFELASLFAQMARYNTLYMISRAGSGHLGSSFSSLDIVSYLYLFCMKSHDRFFSSKGHDAPGLYSVLAALGILPFDLIHNLRRLDGLPGHPDIEIPGMFTNTGSLGMGVSKAKGFLAADDLKGKNDGKVYVMTGDGELQEGQFWESLLSAGRLRNGKLKVIVDHNKIQSDTFVDKVNDLGDLKLKFTAFGFECRRCDGHDLEAFANVLEPPTSDGRPLAIIADTIKGRGVSFMEHTAMSEEQEYYQYHSGAPSIEDYVKASNELIKDINSRCEFARLSGPSIKSVSFDPLIMSQSSRKMIPYYSDALISQAKRNKNLVALDADLVLDTGLIPFKNSFEERFFECGISEMDMVSQAGTMALGGLLPIVHSFSCFLTTRPIEQIYNNWSEKSKVVYVGSLAGILPGGPGHSHQAMHDLTTMSGLPGFAVLEPFSADQIAPLLDWAINSHSGSSYIRLTSIPYNHQNELVDCGYVERGKGHLLRSGKDLTFVVTNPVLTSEVLQAADFLQSRGTEATVIATPWINLFDRNWYEKVLPANSPLITVENHFVDNGFGTQFITFLAESGLLPKGRILRIGLKELPASGRNEEILKHHELDSKSIANLAMNINIV